MTDENGIYDVIIVGAGPAGLAAGLYAARDRYKTLLLEKNGLPGGQIMLTERIENYPGYENVSGFDLVEHMKTQVTNFGAEIAVNKAVDTIVKRDDGPVFDEDLAHPGLLGLRWPNRSPPSTIITSPTT